MFGLSIFLFGIVLLSLIAGTPIARASEPTITFHDAVPDTHTFLDLAVTSDKDVHKCETTTGSPEAEHLISAAKLVKERTFCCQDNGLGSHCQEKARFLTAAMGMCGPVTDPAICVNCQVLSHFGQLIAEKCAWHDKEANVIKAGGYMDFTARRFKAIAYHT